MDRYTVIVEGLFCCFDWYLGQFFGKTMSWFKHSSCCVQRAFFNPLSGKVLCSKTDFQRITFTFKEFKSYWCPILTKQKASCRVLNKVIMRTFQLCDSVNDQ